MSSLDVSSPGTTIPCPPSPTNSSILGYIVTHRERHRVHTGPLYGGLKTVHTLVLICSTPACRRVVHAFGTTSQIKTAHPPYCDLPGPASFRGQARAPQLSSQIAPTANHRLCKVISLCLPLDSGGWPSCHSSRNVDSEPREIEPPQRQAARRGPALGNYVPLWQLRRLAWQGVENCRSLYRSTLADLIGSLPRSSFGSDQSVLSSVHSDGTHTHTRRDSQASAAVLLCCSATLLLCSSGQLHQSMQSKVVSLRKGSLSFSSSIPPTPLT